MSDLKVCRICLCKGVKVYNYDSFHLKQYYEEIMARKIIEKDGLPNYFCYECAAVLHKFHKFKEKCWMGEKALKEILWSGPITLTSVSQIDRQDKNLQSSIQIITVSKRVKTYIIKSKTLSKSLLKETKNDEIPEIEEHIYIVEYSDNSLGDKNPAETKNEKIKDHTESIEDEKTTIDMEISKDEKVVSDLEDDRMLSSDDDTNPKNNNDVDKPAIKEQINNEITVEEERINCNPEQTSSDNEIVQNKNHKEKKRKKNQTKTDVPHKKAKKFEENSKKNYLDPKHWLRIKLTEEEALEEFRARAQDRKYVKAAYKCSDCYKGFSKEDMLNRHIKQRHSESLGPVQCRFCNMRFKMKYQLSKHIPQHYNKFKCLRCDRVCPHEYTAVLHNDYHNGVIKKCTHCDEEFSHLTTYYSHLRAHRSEHVCTLCGASFVSVAGLVRHKKFKHVNADTVLPQGEEQYCQRCDIKFETRKAYEEHLIHSAKHDDDNGKRRQDPKRLIKIPTDCHVCGKHFASQAACRKHHLAEHPRTSFFAPNERHICEICGMSLAPGSVATHLNTHTREKTYSCNTCGRQFSTKTGLNTHQLTHTSVKPVACTLCDKRFKQSSSMKVHYRTFHLKEPYPKRNRKKKNDDLSNDEFSHEDSDDNMTLDNFTARNYKRNK